jgi:hypothetical protein
MEENLQPKQENEFVFSKAVKAGKRIYYLDVRRTRNNNDLYLAITESKKILSGTPENPTFTFAKQKVLLYKEDFKNFTDALQEVIDFVEKSSNDESIDNNQVKGESKPRKPEVKPVRPTLKKNIFEPKDEQKSEPEKSKGSFFGRLFGSNNDNKNEQSEEKSKTDSYFDDINFDV